jgi:hypothetical protein
MFLYFPFTGVKVFESFYKTGYRRPLMLLRYQLCLKGLIPGVVEKLNFFFRCYQSKTLP